MVVHLLHTEPGGSSNLLITTKFPLVVKWYNSRLITGHYKFDSCREDQVKDSNSKLKKFYLKWKKDAILFYYVGVLCNGSTTDFDSVSLGSIPNAPTNYGVFSVVACTLLCESGSTGSIPVGYPNLSVV